VRTLSVACCAYDRTRPVLDGRVSIAGYAVRPFPLPLEEILDRAYSGAEFDVVELGLGSYVRHWAQGTCPYVAIPAFPLRAFRHRAIYVRRDRISTPQHLAGKRVGVLDYVMTAAVVLRGLLRRCHRVETETIRWVVGGIETPARKPPDVPPGANVKAAPDGMTLSSLLENGDVDALIALRPPSSFKQPGICRLFGDDRTAEMAHFAETGEFPIMHVIAVRRSIADEPGLARAVQAAFTAARDNAMAALAETQAAKVTLPWAVAAYEDAQTILGHDYWPYGLPRNRPFLEAFLEDAHRDRLTDRQLHVDELFQPDTLDA
jgi:4,5-dihydroxyphthalate decarboxylase